MTGFVINPLTGRRIKVAGKTYKELSKAGYVNQYGGVAENLDTIDTAQDAATMAPEEQMKQDNIPPKSQPQAKGVLNLLAQAYTQWMNQPDAQKSAQITNVMNTLSSVYNSLKE